MATTALTPAATTYRSSLYEWVTTTDHKKIGILYLVNSFVFFFIGGILALGVRSQLAVLLGGRTAEPKSEGHGLSREPRDRDQRRTGPVSLCAFRDSRNFQ